VAALAAWALALPRRGEREPRRAVLLFAAMAALAVSFDFAALPVVNEFKSDRLLVAGMAPYLGAADEVFLHDSEFGGAVNLFTGRARIAVLEELDQVAAALASPRRVAVVMWRKQAAKLPEDARGRVVPPAGLARSFVVVVNWPASADPATRGEH